jgi:hypothetical protein
MDIMDSIIRGQDPVALASSSSSTSSSGKSPSRSSETEPGMQENTSNTTSSTAADGDAAPSAGKTYSPVASDMLALVRYKPEAMCFAHRQYW